MDGLGTAGLAFPDFFSPIPFQQVRDRPLVRPEDRHGRTRVPSVLLPEAVQSRLEVKGGPVEQGPHPSAVCPLGLGNRFGPGGRTRGGGMRS